MEEETKNEETTEEETVEDNKEETGEEVPAAAAEEEKPLDKMTVKDLREVAKVIPGVTGVTAMKKDELLSFIKEYRGIKDEGPVKKKKVIKTGLTVKELKEKAAQLREAKKSAREQNDKNKVKVLRRRINRLKKQSRKAAQA